MNHSRPHLPPPAIVSLNRSLKSAVQTLGAAAPAYPAHIHGRRRRRAHRPAFTICP